MDGRWTEHEELVIARSPELYERLLVRLHQVMSKYDPTHQFPNSKHESVLEAVTPFAFDAEPCIQATGYGPRAKPSVDGPD